MIFIFIFAHIIIHEIDFALRSLLTVTTQLSSEVISPMKVFLEDLKAELKTVCMLGVVIINFLVELPRGSKVGCGEERGDGYIQTGMLYCFHHPHAEYLIAAG